MQNEDRVVPLSRLEDVRVADGDPDVRGWEVRGGQGELLGRVRDLLVDTEAMKVRYLELGVDPEVLDGDRRVLVPIGYARMEPDRDCVRVDGLLAGALREHPAFDPERLDREFESSVRHAFSHGLFGETVRADLSADARDRRREDFYGAPEFDSERFYAGRRGRVTDPLAAARWGQVRGDEEGIRSGGTTETRLGRGGERDLRDVVGPGGITEGMGDPGGER